MTKRYAIWNKEDMVITPNGELYTAEQWMEKFPAAAVPTLTVVCAAGEVNGGFFSPLGQMIQVYGANGCDFSACTTDEEILEAIEAFEDAMNTPSTEATTDERIAAALEAQVMMSMPDAE